MPEQYLAAAVALAEGIEPAFALSQTERERGSGHGLAPPGYVHLISTSKRDPGLVARMHARLERDYPATAATLRALHGAPSLAPQAPTL